MASSFSRAPRNHSPLLPISWTGRWPALLVFAVTLVAYWPALAGEFIWDDTGHVTRPALRSLDGLLRIWTDVGTTQQYYPVLHSAFWLQSQIFGDTPAGYHVVTVLLHATAACLFALLLQRLAVRGAWLAALLFALHPVCVESVAWIAEQKNTLSTVLCLAAALVFLRFDVNRRPRSYALATLLYLLALGAKTVTATLPAALLVVLWWRHGRINLRRDVAPLAPWFVCGAMAGVMTAWVERTQIGAAGVDFGLSGIERVLLAGRALWFYLGKLLWPANLIFVYPRWAIDASSAWQYLYPLGAGAVAIAAWRLRLPRGLIAALLIFAGTLFPALGFVNVYPFIYSYVADHFQYLASLAVFALAGAAMAAISVRGAAWWANGASWGILVVLGVLTWRQTPVYRNVFTLYETTLARNPAAWMAHNNLGIALVDAGRIAEAIPHYEAALKLRPDFPEAENNLGFALTRHGDPGAAVPHLERALRLQPKYAEARNNLGIALMALGRADEGQAAFEAALRMNPKYPEPHLNLGLALARDGQTPKAIEHFATAVRLRPGYAEAELNWGIGLTVSNRIAEALPHFERALALRPNWPEAELTRGRALASAGRHDEAIASYRRALELNPNTPGARLALAIALRQVGRTDEAEREYREATRSGAVPPR